MKRISATVLALIFFLCSPAALRGSLPLTETINTLPEGDIELLLREELWDTGRNYRREGLGLGFGLLPSVSLWYQFTYVNRGLDSDRHELGDSFLKLWYYIGDAFDDRLHGGMLLTIRIPTGSSAYDNPDWRNVGFGNNEMRLGPVFQVDILGFFVHLNLHYVFREARQEDFYSGFYINPLKKRTYQKLFGFNFHSSGTFMNKDRLKNDYCIAAVAVNTDRWYPFIPYLEVYGSHRVYRRTTEDDHLPIEGAGVNPILLDAGIRLFLTRTKYAELYCIQNPRRERGYIRMISGFSLGLQF